MICIHSNHNQNDPQYQDVQRYIGQLLGDVCSHVGVTPDKNASNQKSLPEMKQSIHVTLTSIIPLKFNSFPFCRKYEPIAGASKTIFFT